jgi:serine/threonine-protein kinase
MSPEQCRGLSTIDHRTDIYSLGCVLFQMLTGRPPFGSENLGDLLVDHITRPPPKLTSFDATLPAALDSLIARLLAKAPEERPGSMLDVAAELEALERISQVAALAPTMALPAAVPTPVPPPTPVAEGVASSASSWAVARSHVRGPDGRGAPTTPRRRWLTVPGVLVAIGGLVLVGALVALRGGQHAASPENARSGGAPPSTAPVAAPTVATPPAPPPSVAPPVAPHPKPEPPTAVAPESQGGSTAKANEAPAPSPAKKGRSPRTTPKSASEKATTRDAILDL